MKNINGKMFLANLKIMSFDETRVSTEKRDNIMNYRISKKIYKRADFKLKSFIAANYDKRTTYDIAKEENILSGLERSIFISKQNKWTKRINDIVDELKVEEQTMDEEVQR